MVLRMTRPKGLSSTQRTFRRRADAAVALTCETSAAPAGATGRRAEKQNREPRPGVEVTVKSPPINLASPFTTERPRPAPPQRRAISALACENGRNKGLISSGLGALALSVEVD